MPLSKRTKGVMSFNVGNNGEGSSTGGPAAGWEFGTPNLKLITRVIVVVAAVVLVIVALFVAKGIFTDWLWFDSLGFLDVFTKILVMRIWLFFAAALLVAALLLINLYIAYRFARGESVLPVPLEVFRLARWGVIAGSGVTVFLMSVVFGFVAQGRWETFLLFLNRVSFGVEDPQFHKDMSFHVAVMPMLHFIQGWFMGVVIAILVAVVALYLAIFAVRGVKFVLTPRIRGHLAILGAFLMLTIAAAHYLDIFELVFSGRGAAPGAGYTDVNARIPVLWLLVGIAVVSAAGFATSLFYGGARLMIASFSLWAVLAILGGAIYPVGFQRFRVNPNEFEREETFINRAMVATRAAYNLGDEDIDEQIFDYSPILSPEIIADNPETISNIRLWDHRPLRDTYEQKQAIRQYYNFVGVDSDRYRIDGQYRQAMLAARELFPEKLEENAQNWVNRKLTYTHGYGVAMSPVTEHTAEGLPTFFLEDVPPKGKLEVRRPEIYYGENTRDFVLVNTKTREFDYRGGEEQDPIYVEEGGYKGDGGVRMGSFLRRVAYAWQMLDLNLLISGQITSESRIQYRRQIQDRVSTIAPFLHLDKDPYLVVGDGGKLWWIQDTYTMTDRYAYSALSVGEFNYIRNSVKVVIDAFHGTVHFLVIDPDDPLIQIYQRAFPDLFKDFSEIDQLDPSLRQHIRYPLDLFSAQAEIYLRYHMREPKVFFQREDLWARAREVFETATNTQDVEPYYLIMKLPGEEEGEFVLLMPFTPGGVERKVLVGWMAARNDGENYGKLVTLLFPKDRPVDGPELIEGRITNDETIGAQMTLLCTGAKQCIRGNLLAIPIGDTLLYVEPLYIQAEALRFPELKKVIVADASNVVMADTLDEGLCILQYGEEACLEGAPPVLVKEPPTAGEPGEEEAVPLGPSGLTLEEIRKQIGDISDTVDEVRQSLDELEKALEE